MRLLPPPLLNFNDMLPKLAKAAPGRIPQLSPLRLNGASLEKYKNLERFWVLVSL
jgi:hypothetical protein